LQKHGYTEPQLRQNRVSVLIHGGSPGDRRAWAEVAAAQFPDEGALFSVPDAGRVAAALGQRRGVVFVEDVAHLGRAGQLQLVHALFHQEERPKWIVGLSGPPEQAVGSGALREDLWFRLGASVVDAGDSKVQSMLKARKVDGPAPARSRLALGNRTARAPARVAKPQARRRT
jgi:hypothetical protein